MKSVLIRRIVASVILFGGIISNCQAKQNDTEILSNREQAIVRIAAFTANGDLDRLNPALHEGLDAGLTINEIKEVIVHTYAYCGFPRSIRALQTFMEVLDNRKEKGIQDRMGIFSTPVLQSGNKYERGKKILSELTNAPQEKALTGYAAFAPIIDSFLKEHLFADIFERDVLTYAQRELVTISVLSSIGGVEPMLRGHLSISLNVGITAPQLTHFLTVIEPAVGTERAGAAKSVLLEVLKNRSGN